MFCKMSKKIPLTVSRKCVPRSLKFLSWFYWNSLKHLWNGLLFFLTITCIHKVSTMYLIMSVKAKSFCSWNCIDSYLGHHNPESVYEEMVAISHTLWSFNWWRYKQIWNNAKWLWKYLFEPLNLFWMEWPSFHTALHELPCGEDTPIILTQSSFDSSRANLHSTVHIGITTKILQSSPKYFAETISFSTTSKMDVDSGCWQ